MIKNIQIQLDKIEIVIKIVHLKLFIRNNNKSDSVYLIMIVLLINWKHKLKKININVQLIVKKLSFQITNINKIIHVFRNVQNNILFKIIRYATLHVNIIMMKIQIIKCVPLIIYVKIRININYH